MDILRNIELIISLVQGRAYKKIETLGGIAKRMIQGMVQVWFLKALD